MESSDWQTSCKYIKERGIQILNSGQWADCTFLLGSETHQEVIKGHKLLLAMASPVFEAMFFGGIPEKNEPISILDVQPEAFKSLLEYIYTDNINITSFDKACELCYAAKKYMLPHLVKECTNFLWSDLHPKNVCRAYEFAKLFEESVLMERCLQMIRYQTLEVLSDSSFEDIELTTVIKIFEQDKLNIDSELDLFDAAVRYANAQSNNPCQSTRFPIKCNSTPLVNSDSSTSVNNNGEVTVSNSNEQSSSTSTTEDERVAVDLTVSPAKLTIQNAIQNIRFLTLTPQQFAEGPAKSNLFTQAEAFSILMCISSPRTNHCMPEGFITSTECRLRIASDHFSLGVQTDAAPAVVIGQKRRLTDNPQLHFPSTSDIRRTTKYYCQRAIIHHANTNICSFSALECSLTFTVDKNICVLGVQVPTQASCHTKPEATTYSEILYAHLLDADGSRLTYTHYTNRVTYDGLLDVLFNRPVQIQRNRVYKIGVSFNRDGWYPVGTGSPMEYCDNVVFSFAIGQNNDSIKDGLIKAIIFTY